jgi:hypothetical protein
LIYLAIGSCAVTAQDNRLGRATFAEMVAYARVAAGPCGGLAPDAEEFHALALMRLIKPPPLDVETDDPGIIDRLGVGQNEANTKSTQDVRLDGERPQVIGVYSHSGGREQPTYERVGLRRRPLAIFFEGRNVQRQR